MKLSFVIPAHNEEKNIGTCLASILGELKEGAYDAEIIVVNNASTDRTKEIALRYPGVHVIDEPKKGILWARQAGYLASTGDLIANVDADTMLTKGWVKKVFFEFSRNTKLVAFSGPFIYYDLPTKMNILVKIFYYLGFLSYLMNHYIFRISGMLQGGNYILRRSALTAIGGYDTRIEFYGEDTDVARRIRKVGEVKFSFDLPIYSSGRRLASEGAFTVGMRYGLNYLWMIFFKRPFTQTSIAIRPENTKGALTYRPVDRMREWVIATILVIILFTILGILGYLAYKLILHIVARYI